jgi:FdhD protein
MTQETPESRGKLSPDGSTVEYPVLKITAGDREQTSGSVVREYPLTIILNNREMVTLLCYPQDLKDLVVGFLASEGFVETRDDLRDVLVDKVRGVVRVTTAKDIEDDPDVIFKRVISTGCGRGISFYSPAHEGSLKVESAVQISSDWIAARVKEFQHRSSIYANTHGVHSAALCDADGLHVFAEDIGRHNAIDKVFGRCLLEDIPTRDKIILTSGRVTSEILHKVARREVPVLVSISAPTNLGVDISDALGITLVALVRGGKMNVYTHEERILPPAGA